jgi:hypothetical protein
MDGHAAMTVFIDAYGLREMGAYFERAPAIANRAAKFAINDTTERKGLKLARDAMLAQVAWPAGYLNPPRFALRYKATDDRLEAAIGGRQTPTSLARFTGRRTAARGQKIAVTIRPGRPVTIERAFLINLRGGNLGLGIRLKEGEILHGSIGAKLITSGPLRGVALLYGPSVDQVFRTVAVDISPPMLNALTTEFLRQFDRLSRNG